MAYGILQAGRDYRPTGGRNKDGRPLSAILREIDLGDGRVVPVGFITDWGSVPEFADDLFGIDTRRGSLAYLTHDFNYRHAARSRLVSDWELKKDQKAEGVGQLERLIVFLTLRLFGGQAYQNKSHAG